MTRLRTRPVLVALLIGIAAQLLFAVHLDRPSKIMFDEVHYVPAARALLDLSEPRNIEHPLLGKALIASGIAMFGDNPVGWRAMSTLAGTATVIGVFWMLMLLFGRPRTAAFGALLVMINQMVFVQARIGMLDGFMGMFVVLGIAALLWAMRGEGMTRFAVAGVLLGAGVAVKWTAIPYVAAACLGIPVMRWWLARKPAPVRDEPVEVRPSAFHTASVHVAIPPATGSVGVVPYPLAGYIIGATAIRRNATGVLAAMLLGLTALITYFATFTPAFFYTVDPMSWGDLWPQQLRMLDLQTQVLASHPYQSSWWQWPLILRPIWYFYEPDAGAVRGVLLVGNPLVMWGGLVAVATCLIGGIAARSGRLVGVAGLWIFSLAIWAVIPKSLGFYYYYYLSSIFLCIALAAAFDRFARGRRASADLWFMGFSTVLFAYFYPILAAGALVNDQGFTRWMWFQSWM